MTDVATLEHTPLRPSYLARAFLVQYNLILLGGAGLFSLASASAWPLALGAGAELAWLLVGSNLGAVRRWLDRREAFAESDEHAAEATAFAAEPPVSFDRPYLHRINLFDRAVAELRALQSVRAAPGFSRSLELFEPLRQAFLAICEAHQGTLRFLDATPEAELTGEVDHLQEALGREHDLSVKMGLRQALVLARRRVEQRQTMTTELGTLALRLETIERAVAHLLKQGRALGATAELAAEIEALGAELGLTR